MNISRMIFDSALNNPISPLLNCAPPPLLNKIDYIE